MRFDMELVDGGLASLSVMGGGTGRSRKHKEDKICGVCGDRALGYNFDAISCESCKAFFRRNAPKGLDYFKCPYDEKCKMDISNRRFCKRCRLKKCFEIGMRKEYILTEEEKARKRQKIEENSFSKRDNRMMTGIMREWENTGMVKQEPATSQTRVLTSEQLQHIEEVVDAFRASLEVTVDKSLPRDAAKEFSDLINIAEIGVRRVIDMAKKVKPFKALPQADQISLLKGGSIELLILRSVINYDKDKDHFLDKTDNEVLAMTTEQFRCASGNLFEEHMKFVRSLSVDLNADETTLILLLVIALFSPDRPNLFNKNLVWQEQERYSMLLLGYLEYRYPVPQARYLYPKLLMKLVDLRDLNEQHSQVLLKVNPEVIQPLMQEVLDMRA